MVWNKGLTKENDERVRGYSETRVRRLKKGKIKPPNLGRKFTKEHKMKISKSESGKEVSRKTRKIISKNQKRNFKNPEFLEAYKKARKVKPNKKEKILIELFKIHNFPYQYVGNFKFWIDGRNPDFLNINGQKKVIELFGDYWHKLEGRETPKQRIRHFNKFGFDCLIIWERELAKSEEVMEKIRRFEEHGSES